MIGQRFTEGEAVYEVAAQHGGLYVLQRVDEFEPPQEVSAAELADRFDVAANDPAQPDEQAGWDALAEANREGALRAVRGDFEPEPTPEDVFREAAEDA